MEEHTTYLAVNSEFYSVLNLDKLAAWPAGWISHAGERQIEGGVHFFVSVWNMFG